MIFKDGSSYTRAEAAAVLFVHCTVLWVGHSSGVFSLPDAKQGTVTQHLHPRGTGHFGLWKLSHF